MSITFPFPFCWPVWVIKSLSQGGKRISCSLDIWAELARSPLWLSSYSTSFFILITLDDDEWPCFDTRTTFMDSTCNKMRSKCLKGKIGMERKKLVEDSWEDEDLGNAVVHVRGNTFILKAEIQGLSAWCWPWVRWIGLCVDARTMKASRENYCVSILLLLSSCSCVWWLLFGLGWIWGVFVETNVIFLRMVGMFTIFFLYFFKGWSSGKFTGNHSVICLITFTKGRDTTQHL